MTPPSPRLPLALAFASALAVYALGAAPTVLTGDSAEIQSVALLGGVAHPTGYPTAILAGRLFGVLLPGDPAHRVTMMSAVFGALAVALVARLLLELGLTLPGALAGAMIYGTTYTFWTSALRAEVYTFSITLALLALWRGVVALRSHRTRPALVAGFLLGLALTGHLAFALPVAVLGATLAWRVGRTAVRPVPHLASLAAAFLAGLTPYLGLVWADTQPFAMNYLRYVDLGFFPAGPPPYFDSPIERVWWLITARNQLPPEPVVVAPRAFAHGLLGAATQIGLFEPGPVALPLALVGLRRQLGGGGGLGLLFVAMFALSVAFSAALSSGFMTAVFLTPATLVFCLWVARGVEAAIGWAGSRGPRAAAQGMAAAALLSVLVCLSAHALRAYARDHGLGPLRIVASSEVDERSRGLFPSLRGYREPRRFGEAVFAVVPESALVIGRWPELMTLAYLHHVEGRRPDLRFQPLIYPQLLTRIAGWQQAYAPADRPLAIVSGFEELRHHVVDPDSLAAGSERWVHLVRFPLAGVRDSVRPTSAAPGAARGDQRWRPSLR